MAEPRPDLAMVEVQQVGRYYADMIFPPVNRFGKVGNIYFQQVDADVAAQTGRAGGAAPTKTTLASVNDTFSCTEKIKRADVPDDEERLIGGMLNAEMKAARIGKRSIMRNKEDAAVAALLAAAQGGGNDRDILDSFQKTLDVAIVDVERVSGKLIWVCGFTTFRRLTRYPEITNTLLRIGVPQEAVASSVRNIDAPTLASIIGVEEVWVGNDDHWTAGEGYVIKAPEPGVEPDELAQMGRQVQFLPDGQQPFLMESFFNDIDKTDVVDTRVWNDFKTFNAEAVTRLKGIDELNAITTTTTTTT